MTRVYLTTRRGSGNVGWRTVTVGVSPDAEDAVFFDADNDGVLDVVAVG